MRRIVALVCLVMVPQGSRRFHAACADTSHANTVVYHTCRRKPVSRRSSPYLDVPVHDFRGDRDFAILRGGRVFVLRIVVAAGRGSGRDHHFSNTHTRVNHDDWCQPRDATREHTSAWPVRAWCDAFAARPRVVRTRPTTAFEWPDLENVALLEKKVSSSVAAAVRTARLKLQACTRRDPPAVRK